MADQIKTALNWLDVSSSLTLLAVSYNTVFSPVSLCAPAFMIII